MEKLDKIRNPSDALPSTSLRYIRRQFPGGDEFCAIISKLCENREIETLKNSLEVLSDFGDFDKMFPELVKAIAAAHDEDEYVQSSIWTEMESHYANAIFAAYLIECGSERHLSSLEALLQKSLSTNSLATAEFMFGTLLARTGHHDIPKITALTILAHNAQLPLASMIIDRLLNGRYGDFRKDDRVGLIAKHLATHYEIESTEWNTEFITKVANYGDKLTSRDVEIFDNKNLREILVNSALLFCTPIFELFPEYIGQNIKIPDRDTRNASLVHVAMETLVNDIEKSKDPISKHRNLSSGLRSLKFAGLDLNELDENGYTPLSRVFLRGESMPSVSLIKTLVDAGMNPDIRLPDYENIPERPAPTGTTLYNPENNGKSLADISDDHAWNDVSTFLRSSASKHAVLDLLSNNASRPRSPTP